MQRHFVISDDLDDLEHLEEELEAQGVPTPQIHVFTLDDTGAENHVHLHDVQSLMKRDVVHSLIIGAIIGVIVSASVLAATALFNWHDSAAGWMPFIFLAIIALGFCTWEGGLFGVQTLNHHFKKFKTRLEEGNHVFFCDLEPGQEAIFRTVVNAHPKAELAGTGASTPRWIMAWQTRLGRLFGETLP
ncbi:MAG: hypothetical protein OES38_06575 [Gammaproteobacteria bacterium]|nr:hypothetical protein [Gammaproteobacteria bacterium]